MKIPKSEKRQINVCGEVGAQLGLVGLIAAAGLRLGETIRLNCEDISFDQRVLTIRETKSPNRNVLNLTVSACWACPIQARMD